MTSKHIREENVQTHGHLKQSPSFEIGKRKRVYIRRCKPLFNLVRLAGIEPTTPWFVAKYSIQLSYSRSGKTKVYHRNQALRPSSHGVIHLIMKLGQGHRGIQLPRQCVSGRKNAEYVAMGRDDR